MIDTLLYHALWLIKICREDYRICSIETHEVEGHIFETVYFVSYSWTYT